MLKRPFVLLQAGLLLASLLGGCAARQPDAAGLVRLEYYLRWNRAEFRAEHAWLPAALAWIVPAARAELPPQYQKAFSLVIEPQASDESLAVEYQSRMVTDPATYKRHTARLGKLHYQRLMAALAGKHACESTVGPGWAGPAPEILQLEYPDRSDWLYLGGPQGPDGPGAEASERNQRRYLCHADLQDFLAKLKANLEGEASSD